MNLRRGPRASCLSCALVCVFAAVMPPAVRATTPCEEIVGFNLVSRAPGIFVSDMHGTSEPPAFLRALVCNLVYSGRAVVIALEYPSAEQGFIDEFLRARTPTPQLVLLGSPFWSRPTQDGRTSRAMLSLLEWVRQETANGARIRVVAFDSLPATSNQPGSAASFDTRDRAMAQRLRQELSNAAADEMPVIFTGNVHARKTKERTARHGERATARLPAQGSRVSAYEHCLSGWLRLDLFLAVRLRRASPRQAGPREFVFDRKITGSCIRSPIFRRTADSLPARRNR
jgi:hypothetical protein